MRIFCHGKWNSDFYRFVGILLGKKKHALEPLSKMFRTISSFSGLKLQLLSVGVELCLKFVWEMMNVVIYANMTAHLAVAIGVFIVPVFACPLGGKTPDLALLYSGPKRKCLLNPAMAGTKHSFRTNCHRLCLLRHRLQWLASSTASGNGNASSHGAKFLRSQKCVSRPTLIGFCQRKFGGRTDKEFCSGI